MKKILAGVLTAAAVLSIGGAGVFAAGPGLRAHYPEASVTTECGHSGCGTVCRYANGDKVCRYADEDGVCGYCPAALHAASEKLCGHRGHISDRFPEIYP